MEENFETQAKELYDKANALITTYFKPNNKEEQEKLPIPEDFKKAFFELTDKVNADLIQDKDNFFGYFLMQMDREIRFDIASPTGVNFKKAKYVIYFNPLLFLNLSIKQMESTIKHEILHIVSLHLIRARESKNDFGALAANMAMDIVVNTYLDHLPPYSTTIDWVNFKYGLKLLPFKTFEYYAKEIQIALDLADEEPANTDEDQEDIGDTKEDLENITKNNKEKHEDMENHQNAEEEQEQEDSDTREIFETEFDPLKTHDLWEESDDIEDKTLQEFTEKFSSNAKKGTIPNYVEGILSTLKSSRGELPWNLYLKKMMGTVESNPKKTVTRRNRRQPERLDLRGELRGYKAKIAVAIDISASISDAEFNQAMKEVMSIVKNYNHEITVIECDNEIRRVYQIKSAKDIRERIPVKGATSFNPVIEYANANNINLLIYFTDGKGEEKLLTIPRGYKTLWVISGRGDTLSLKEPYGPVKKLKHIDLQESTSENETIIRGGFSMNYQEPERIL